MNKIKKIAIFTGNRAEFGLLSPIIRSLIDVKKFDVKIIASGSHLEKNYGSTIKEIKDQIIQTVKIYEPRAIILNVATEVRDDSHEVKVTVTFRVVNTNETVTTELNLTRLR